jgi:hypothetical protein
VYVKNRERKRETMDEKWEEKERIMKKSNMGV